MITSKNDIRPYETRDGSLVRERVHPNQPADEEAAVGPSTGSGWVVRQVSGPPLVVRQVPGPPVRGEPGIRSRSWWAGYQVPFMVGRVSGPVRGGSDIRSRSWWVGYQVPFVVGRISDPVRGESDIRSRSWRAGYQIPFMVSLSNHDESRHGTCHLQQRKR